MNKYLSALTLLLCMSVANADDEMFPETDSNPGYTPAQVALAGSEVYLGTWLLSAAREHRAAARIRLVVEIGVAHREAEGKTTELRSAEAKLAELARLDEIETELRAFERQFTSLRVRQMELDVTLELSERAKIAPSDVIRAMHDKGQPEFMRGWQGDLADLKRAVAQAAKDLENFRPSVERSVLLTQEAQRLMRSAFAVSELPLIVDTDASIRARFESRVAAARAEARGARILGGMGTLIGATLIADAVTRLGLLLADRDPGLTPAGSALLELLDLQIDTSRPIEIGPHSLR